MGVIAIPVIDASVKIGGSLIDKLIPDPQAKMETKIKLLELAQKGELAELEANTNLALQQIAVNMKEAESPSLFKGGWRPATGWVCVFGLGYQFVVQPLAAWGSTIWAVPVPPLLQIDTLMTLLFGMLGLGAFRTYEKKEGVASK